MVKSVRTDPRNHAAEGDERWGGTSLVLEIDFGADREGALRAFAHLIGVSRDDLHNTGQPFEFSGACMPNLFTLLRPAEVALRNQSAPTVEGKP